MYCSILCHGGGLSGIGLGGAHCGFGVVMVDEPCCVWERGVGLRDPL